MKNDIVKLALDAHRGAVAGNYSATDSMETLRKALVDANHGSAVITPRMVREGTCNDLFAIMETVIQKTSEEGLTGNEFFNECVESKNTALGDQNSFYVEDDNMFVVSTISEGNQSIRRQKYEGGQDFRVNTTLKAIKVYEEMNRVLAGRIDFNKFIDKVSEAFTNANLNEIYSEFVKGMASIESPYSAGLTSSGSFDEDTLLSIIDHVEAATGASARIIGARSALRKVATATVSDEAKSDAYNMGYYGKFNGTPMIAMKQRHAIGSTNFILPQNDLYIVATTDKFVKHITEGETMIATTGFWDNQDLTQEYMMMQRTGNAVVMSSVAGIYRIA